MRVTPKRLTTQAPQLDICCLPNWWVYRQGDAIGRKPCAAEIGWHSGTDWHI